jgi:hypothetical protein
MSKNTNTGNWSKIGDILKISDRYCIREDGRLYSLKNRFGYRKMPKLIGGSLCDGYLKHTILIDGKRTKTGLHRLLSCQYLGLDFTDKDAVVNHIDGNKLNNHLNNLEVVSRAINSKHAKNIGLYANAKPKCKPDFEIFGTSVEVCVADCNSSKKQAILDKIEELKEEAEAL